tara:strand:+ start:370 stop:900 length:531 start_codon:yes stop_codon:yes gene_type:complete
MEQKLNHKLAIIQTELKASKGKHNKFGDYKYRSAEDILMAIKPHLLKHQVSVRIQEKLVDTNIIESTAIIFDGIEEISASALVGVDIQQKGMAMPQRFGAASSYAKKYSLGNLFLIDNTKDDDATNTYVRPKKLLENTPEFKNALKALNDGKTIEDIEEFYTLTNEVKTSLLNQIK